MDQPDQRACRNHHGCTLYIAYRDLYNVFGFCRYSPILANTTYNRDPDKSEWRSHIYVTKATHEALNLYHDSGIYNTMDLVEFLDKTLCT